MKPKPNMYILPHLSFPQLEEIVQFLSQVARQYSQDAFSTTKLGEISESPKLSMKQMSGCVTFLRDLGILKREGV